MNKLAPNVSETEFSQYRWEQLMTRWNLSRNSGEDYNCQHCRSNWHLGPMVKDSIWNAICIAWLIEPRSLLCLPCMEMALGRPITKRDEPQAEILWNVWRRGAILEIEL